MVNKKGAFTTGQLLSLVLGAVAVVVVIIGFSQGWGIFTDIFDQADLDMEIISQKCNALTGASGAGYCTDKIEIAKNSYVNCEYAFDELGAVVDNPLDCGLDAPDQICEKIKLAEGKNYDGTEIMVNGEECCEGHLVCAD